MQSTRKLVWGAVGLTVLAAAIFLTQPVAEGIQKKKTNLPKSSKKNESVFTEEDDKANFGRLTSMTKNAFVPLVLKKSGGKVGGLYPNQVPADYANGESGWTYTGTAVIDNVPQALFENKAKFEALYVRVGQKWLGTTIVAITATTVELSGPMGQRKRLDLMADPPESASKAPAPMAGSLPPAEGLAQFGGASSGLGVQPITLPAAGGIMMGGAMPGGAQAVPSGVVEVAAPAATNSGRRQGGRRNRGGPQSNQPNLDAASPGPVALESEFDESKVALERLPETPEGDDHE